MRKEYIFPLILILLDVCAAAVYGGLRIRRRLEKDDILARRSRAKRGGDVLRGSKMSSYRTGFRGEPYMSGFGIGYAPESMNYVNRGGNRSRSIKNKKRRAKKKRRSEEMNKMAMVEYLLTEYAGYSAKANDAKKQKDDFDYAYYDAKEDFALTVLQECFGMNVCETGDGYVAYGGGKSVEVKKIKSNYKN